ncbi:MAG: RNA 2',3'-cyclic phosphodiesterase [Sedimentisphaerales bacterium]|jgi:2'-5' RNA ligase
MRCFIAIDIDGKIRKAIADLQKQIASKVDVKKGDLKWVEPNNIHLTLKFLGEISDEQVAEVSEIAKTVAQAHQKFNLEIESVGSFPPTGSQKGGGRSAKVVWVGAGKGTDALLALQKDLDDLLAQAGYPKEEREFSAHLTLCRVNHPMAGFKMGEAIAQFSHLKLGSIAAESLCVYQSQLTPAGPTYTLLGEFKLR